MLRKTTQITFTPYNKPTTTASAPAYHFQFRSSRHRVRAGGAVQRAKPLPSLVTRVQLEMVAAPALHHDVESVALATRLSSVDVGGGLEREGALRLVGPELEVVVDDAVAQHEEAPLERFVVHTAVPNTAMQVRRAQTVRVDHLHRSGVVVRLDACALHPIVLLTALVGARLPAVGHAARRLDHQQAVLIVPCALRSSSAACL
eukprot:4157433-Prymnesium_polylepis.3